MIFRKKEIEAQVEALIHPLVHGKGYEVVAVEYLKTHEGMVLRLYVDRAGGITSDELVAIHREVEEKLKAVPLPDLAYRQYQLEISSPGINRIIKKKSDFERFKGEKVQIHLQEALEGEPDQKNFTGILKEVKGDMVLLQVNWMNEEKVVEIPLNQIKLAHLRVEMK